MIKSNEGYNRVNVVEFLLSRNADVSAKGL